MRFLLVRMCAAVCLFLGGISSGMGQAVANRLPQKHDCQRVMRAYMAKLTEKDFTHGVEGIVDEQKSFAQDPDYLYRNNIFTYMNQPLVGTKRGTPAVNAPPGCFVLANIERADGVYIPPVWPEALMSFVQWEFPGNAYYNNRALKLRAFVSATVQMLMFQQFAEENDARQPSPIRPDWHGYNPVYWAAPYPGFKDVLPPEVQKAYETCLKMAGERIMAWGIRGETCENDLLAPLGLVYISRAINDIGFATKVEAYARPVFTDARFVHPAGYWVERGGPDTGFGGTANLYATWIALMTDWAFAKDAVARAYRLRSHLILPDPDGQPAGPSHFNSRLGSPAFLDQFAWDGVRETAAAMVTDEALHLVKVPSPEVIKSAPVTRAHAFNTQLKENTRDATGHYYTTRELTVDNTMYPWKLKMWMTFNFPISINPAYEFYRKGFYARLQGLEKNNSPLLKSPFLRGENFVRNFDKTFVVTRQTGFAAILHTGPVGFQSPDDNKTQFKGPMGLGGGQLSAFWTPTAGSVILGLRSGMTYDKSFDSIEAWRTWPMHSVSGVSGDGVFFTSARIQAPDVTVDTKGNTAVVKVAGVIPAGIVGQEKAISGTYEYNRSFAIAGDGVRIETTIRGDGKDSIAELYEVLPVYLREAEKQAAQKPTVIEFQSGGTWTPATVDYREGVTAVKLTRFTGAVQVTFDRPQRVKLSPADWQDAFITRATARNILIDLMPQAGKSAALKDVRSVGYRVAAVVK